MNANTKTQTTTRHCLCGCGGSTSSSKTQYRPGHDARHAGSVARDYAAYLLANGAESTDHAHSMLDELGSDRLRIKATNMATKIIAKATGQLKKPADRKPKSQTQENSDRVGEWLDAHRAAFKAAHKAAAEVQALSKIKGEPVEAMWDEEDQDIIEEAFPVKIGRWTYPARFFNGEQQRNTKRDGSGEWIPYEG